MPSQSLYRKWRSQTFADLVGQEAVVRTLLNAVRDGRLAHAYLFCGPRGTGKTSTARLLAKAVNCANPRDGEPCNECLSCREITAGRSPDVVEIDAASHTGVDNIRDLRETVGLLGVGGHYRMIVIDEVHMLSTAAFNALLKTLEEPPPHIIFVLATTEAHKVLPTVVSRCQRFDFRRITTRDILAHLRLVAAAEGLALEPGAAELLARAAQGGMRDALSLLDQAMAYCGAEIGAERLRAMLGLADPGLLRRLIADVAAQRSADGLALINDLVTAGADLRQLNSQLADEWRALVLARAGADVAALTDRSDDEAREIAALAAHFSLDELTACARVFARNETPARGLPVPQLALELSFLECVGLKARGGQPAASPNAAISAMPPASQTPRPSQNPARSAMPPASSAASPRANAAEPATPLASQPSTLPRNVAISAMPPASPAPERPAAELDLAAIERDAPPLGTPASLSDMLAPTVGASGGRPSAPGLAPANAVGASGGRPATADSTPSASLTDEPQWLEETPAAYPADDMLLRAQSQWDLIKQVCKQKSRSVAALLHSARPVLYEPGEAPALVVQADFKFHHDKLREPANRAAVEWALQQVLEAPLRIKVVVAGTSGSGGPEAPNGPNGPSGPRRPSGNSPSEPTYPTGGGSPASSRPAAPSGNGLDREHAQNGTSGNHGNGARPASTSAQQRDQQRDQQRESGSAVHDATAPYTSLSGAPASAPTRRPPDIRPVRTLEEEVRADPVVQALMRSSALELADVRPLDEDDE